MNQTELVRTIEISAREVRRIVVGDPYARKLEVAQAIVEMGFGTLRPNLPNEPPHPIFGYKPRDRYWLHMFDALAVALAARPRTPTANAATRRANE